MEFERLVLPGFDISEATAEHKIYPCWSARLNRKTNEIEIYKNNKSMQKIPMSDFPSDIDFNNVNHISAIIKVAKEEGLVGLMNKYRLK